MALSDWWRRGGAAQVDEGRWLVVDTETTGLDPARDQLLAIAAVAVHIDWVGRRMHVAPGDSFEVFLRPERTAADQGNILLHGIGVQRQAQGVAPRDALEAFAQFAGPSPLLAFHAAFDQAVLQRACVTSGAAPMAARWADLEVLCTATVGDAAGGHALDDWMDHFGLACARRHQAAADALVEAEVLLRIWPALARECGSWSEVEGLAKAGRWLGGR